MASWMTEHWRARKICPPGPCAKCGAIKAEVHHRDEDWHNNAPTNLERLCRRCHYRTHNPVKLCGVTACESKRRRHGYCEKHSQRFEKYGTPFGFKRNQHTPFRVLDD